MLRIEHLSTGYGKKQVIHDVSFEVKQGEIALLIGSNGSGKSTILKAICGLCKVWDGKVFYKNENITNCQTEKLLQKGILYISQKNELFEDMTVKENIEMALLHLNDKRESKKRVEEVIPELEILKVKINQNANKLSGGERKALSLGMVMVNRPKLVLYDEPLSGISGGNINVILGLLKRLNENGTTFVIVEHRIKELLVIADKVVGLRLGKINSEKLDNLESIKSFMI